MTSASPFIIVAIDGGAASGKSSSSRTLSERFNLLHVDTGSFYRALASELLRRGVQPADTEGIARALATIKLGTRLKGRSAEIEIDGRVPGEEIRSAAVNDAVSHFAARPEVRQALLIYQRGQANFARAGNFRGVVMEGRDIGSVIFPDADFRFFLFADAAERVRRRAGQGQADPIHERDRLDSSRQTAPLTCPPGAIAIDTTHISLDEVVEKMSACLAEKLPP